jgi:protein-tyrosine phosphatase
MTNQKPKSIRHFEYNQIDDYIYVGTTICCQKHLNELLALGISADIDLQLEKQDHPAGVKAFLWLPTTDFSAPTQAQLDMGAHFLRHAVKHQIKCYIHCNAGEGRAPTLVAAYYISKGLTPEQAIQKIKQGRPKAQPNQTQMSALAEYYQTVRNKK